VKELEERRRAFTSVRSEERLGGGADRALHHHGAADFGLGPFGERGERQEHHASEAPLAERARERAAEERSLLGGHLREEVLHSFERLVVPAALRRIERVLDLAQRHRCLRRRRRSLVRELPELGRSNAERS